MTDDSRRVVISTTSVDGGPWTLLATDVCLIQINRNLLAQGLHLARKYLDQPAVLVNQEFGEIPFYYRRLHACFHCFVCQVFEKRMNVVAGYGNFFRHRKAYAIVALAELL